MEDDEHVSTSILFPPKPKEPLDSECCGTGCTPCVFNIFKEKLKRWELDCEEISKGSYVQADNEPSTKTVISPYEYSKFVVKEITDDCQSCKILRFKKYGCSEEEPLIYYNFPVKLGQHVVLKIERKTRQYTVLDVTKDGSFTIIFKIYSTGVLTPFIDKLKVEDIVEMRGPFGKEFIYRPNFYQRLVIFAAGTGIAPFSRIIDQVLGSEDDETRIVLYFSCRNETEVLLLGKLKEWTRSWNFSVAYFLPKILDAANAQGMHYGMTIFEQKIDSSVIDKLLSSFSNKAGNLYLICGTKSFEKDMVKYLTNFGITSENIRLF